MEVVDLGHELEKAKGILSESLKESQGTIETDFAAGKDVKGEKVYFESILYNLLSNAIKSRSEERPLLIIIHTKNSIGHFQIIFSDNGIGIDLDRFSGKLFSFYQRFHTHVEGKGIGLFLIKTQVESMSGTIEIKSEVNVGTTFIISFPL